MYMYIHMLPIVYHYVCNIMQYTPGDMCWISNLAKDIERTKVCVCVCVFFCEGESLKSIDEL